MLTSASRDGEDSGAEAATAHTRVTWGHVTRPVTASSIERMNADRPSPMRTLAWAAAAGTAAFLAFLPAAMAATWLSDQGGGNLLRLAAMAALWTLLGVAAVVVIGLVLRTIGRPVARLPVVLTTLGALAAAVVQAAIWASAEMRYGPYPEADYIGMSLFLAPAVTVLTGGLVTSIVALGGARIIGAIVAWLAIGAIGAIFLDSLPGIADGISPSGWLAGAAFATATAFALVAAALLARRHRLRPSA